MTPTKSILVFALLACGAFSEDCVLDVSDPESPFIVTQDLTFPTYDDNSTQTFTFGEEDTFYVVCPKGTQSPYLGTTGDNLNCKGGTNVLNIRLTTIIDYNSIKCKSYGPATVNNLTDTCATNGTLFEIGFDVSDEFLPIITVCFDVEKLTPIYSRFKNTFNEVLPGLRDGDDYYHAYICNGTACGWADSGGLYVNTTTPIDFIYDNQAQTLEDLGIVDLDSSLLRFPLTTTNLWYFNVAKYGQDVQRVPYYDYINVVPMWNFEMLDSWLYVLDTSMIENVGETVYTGVLGVVSLNNTDGEKVDVYLGDGQVPVPKWFWVVFDAAEQVLFYYNNPNYDDSSTEIAVICDKHIHFLLNMFLCTFDAVTDPVVREVIDSMRK